MTREKGLSKAKFYGGLISLNSAELLVILIFLNNSKTFLV